VTLDGRVAMVTGAGQGIGAAIAARLSGLGASVAVCDIDEATADATIKSLPTQSISVGLDVSDRAAVVAAVAHIGEELGPIDILVNNAGIDVIEPFMESTEDTWDRLWEVNLKGQIACCHAVLEAHMIPNARGRIVNLGSDAGRVGSSGEAVYSATKGGVIAFTKTLAREMARYGVTVNCVCPGPTNTALLAQTGDDPTTGLRAALAKSIPMRREGEPDDVAGVVAFLVTDDAAYMTVQTVSVNGGLTMC
jgi:2-hydroxycyclohexanecarboxyl-CoA dehydrogenase